MDLPDQSSKFNASSKPTRLAGGTTSNGMSRQPLIEKAKNKVAAAAGTLPVLFSSAADHQDTNDLKAKV